MPQHRNISSVIENEQVMETNSSSKRTGHRNEQVIETNRSSKRTGHRNEQVIEWRSRTNGWKQTWSGHGSAFHDVAVLLALPEQFVVEKQQ
jgi:hypothetical protein